jgi:glutaredoxin
MKKYVLCALILICLGCGNPPSSPAPSQGRPADPIASAEVVTPPFAIGPEAEGLLLVWYDAEGHAHSAKSRSEIPEPSRTRVRVDSLEVAPEQRLDPAFVYVADLRKPGADGRYAVRKVERDALERYVVPAKPEEPAALANASSDVIIYGASWCGACKQAARYFRSKGVAFVEKDIEKEPAARSEMLSKARAQGVSTSGIPVLDVRGTMLGGFNESVVARLLASK